jgi:hypothetical protein
MKELAKKSKLQLKRWFFEILKNSEKQGFKPKTLVSEGFSPLLGNWVYTGFIINGYFWQILIILILIIEISTAVEIGETCV